MNKIKFITKSFVIGLVLLSFNLAYATESEAEWSDLYSVEVLEERMEMMDGSFDYTLTPEIRTLIKNYTTRYKRGSEELLGRTSIYFPLFERKIEEKRLPQELKYIAVIESSLHPYARSRVGAAGLWQFMKSTGRMMGLKVNSVIDERNDPIKSTEAALDYLSYLHEMFGDWTLAIAAYNCGPGNVKKAIRRSNSTDFWTLRNYLPRETRKYVPKFMAMSYVMNYYLDHGLEPSDEPLKENPTTAKIFTQVNFRTIANSIDMDLKEIRKMNPAYLKGYIPQSEEGYHLTLPEDKLYNFAFEQGTTFEIVYMPEAPEAVEEEIVEEKVEVLPTPREIIHVPIIKGITPVYVLSTDNDYPHSPWSQSDEAVWREEKFYHKKQSFNLRGKELASSTYNTIIQSSIDISKTGLK